MNREQRYNAIMNEASRVYRETTMAEFTCYLAKCVEAGARYRASTGDVLVAQDVCREEIEEAGCLYDAAVAVQLEAYIMRRDAALGGYDFSEFCS